MLITFRVLCCCFGQMFVTRYLVLILFILSPVQTPWTQCDGLPRHREPREHTSEQLSTAFRSRQQIKRLALQYNGRGMVSVAIRAGFEDFEVLDIHVFFFFFIQSKCVWVFDVIVQVRPPCREDVSLVKIRSKRKPRFGSSFKSRNCVCKRKWSLFVSAYCFL